MKLFTNVSNSTNQTTQFNQSGIFQRISTVLQNNVGIVGTTLNNGTLTKFANVQDDYSTAGGSGSGTLPDQIYTKQLLINTLTAQMSSDQTKYYNQFTQLETAMNQINAQQSTISSMASSG
jgi:flagellar hook-associated protein 2